jgi:hypothetical protein
MSQFTIKNVNLRHGGHGINPFIKLSNGIEIRIPNNYLKIFGYVSNGPELGITGFTRTDNITEQTNAVIEILGNELLIQEKEPKWYDIRQYLLNYKGKMRLDKIIPMSKLDSTSIHKTISIVNDSYQDICRTLNRDF